MGMIDVIATVESLKQRVNALDVPDVAEQLRTLEERIAKIEQWIASRPGRKPKDAND